MRARLELSVAVRAAKPKGIPWDPMVEGGPGGVWVVQPCPAGAAGELVRAGTSWGTKGALWAP